MDAVAPETVVFGVEKSFSGRRWLERDYDQRLAMAISQQYSLAEIIGRLLSARDVDLYAVETFLDPRLNTLLPDPGHLLDMDKAVERLIRAINGGEQIAVFGDYDVDGATSSALLKRFFRTVGVDLRIYIPDRMKEGYGPNIQALTQLKGGGTDVVITVDCGTAAYEPLEYAVENNLDVIVVDHHVAEAGLPKAAAVVNPNRMDEDSPHGQLAAVGVTFLLIVALNRGLREAGYYKEKDMTEPDLMALLDLVALGTVADIVPLTGVNRALVIQGLKVFARRRNAGMKALADIAGIDEAPSAYHMGFILGPRVNAGGRVGEAHLGAQLLSTDDDAEAAQIAEALNNYNLERREIEEQISNEAVEQAEFQRGEPIVFVAAEDWHAGVIGIVASRLKERFNVPACVVAVSDGMGVGSGRSVPGVNLGAVVIAARQQGMLVAGGGHAMAAGFTCEAGKLDAFRDFLAERIGKQVEDDGIAPSWKVDGALMVEAATLELIHQVARLGPFGSGNAEPRFVFNGLRVAKVDVVGADHVRCHFADANGKRLQGIAFRSAETELGQALLNHGGLPVHVLGRLRENVWQGRSSVQLMIDDAAPGQ